MASLHVLGRGAAVAVRSAPSSRPASFAQQQQRASWVRGAASNDAVSRVFLFSPSTMTTKPKLFFVQPSSPARSFVLLHEDRERSRCDISKEESPRQALKTWLRSALVGFEMMLRLDDSAPPPPRFLRLAAARGECGLAPPVKLRPFAPFCRFYCMGDAAGEAEAVEIKDAHRRT